jgi:hypothetical protein
MTFFLVGVRTGQASSRDNSGDGQKSEPNSQNRRSREVLSNKVNEKAAKEYYSSGWKSAKGGWVGDFGPEHTRASYTGPEKLLNKKISSLDSRDEYIRDEMLYGIAKDLHSSPSKSKNNDMYEEKRETFPDLESESSMSLDPAIAGAGVGNGMFDNSGVGSDDSNDQKLLSKLEESLSLKSITGSKYE